MSAAFGTEAATEAYYAQQIAKIREHYLSLIHIFELNSILVEKWEGKCYRLVIQRQNCMDGELDLW